MTTDYSYFKKFVIRNLEAKPKPLPKGAIEEAVDQARSVIGVVPPEMHSTVFNAPEEVILMDLSTHDWETLIKELKSIFSVVHDRGDIVNGEEQRNRDTSWWTREVKNKTNLYHWDRYKKYASDNLPYQVVKTIDDDTDVVMNNLVNPLSEDKFSIYGMVVGHVQSGKTGNYTALISKAADAGYKFIVVIAGGLNNLRNQTQERINESFIGRDDGNFVGVGNFESTEKKQTPVSLTNKSFDFNKRDATKAKQSLDLDMGERPFIIVIKKNTSTLSNVISWLKSHYQEEIKDHAMLLIDDESDYASINTKDENNPTSINKKIRALLNLFRKSAYVAYTATPYANIFIDYKAQQKEFGKDLFPEDFIYALKAPTNYFGAEKIFLDPYKKHLVKIEDYEDYIPAKHKKDLKLFELPESLNDAIRTFIINVAIRRLRRQEDKHNSMMIHATRYTNVHHEIYLLVSEYVEDLKKNIDSYGSDLILSKDNPGINSIRNTFNKHYLSSNIQYSWEDVLTSITEIINTIEIREVHKDRAVKLEYPKKDPMNVIVVGGTSLARGYTLEGLSVSYFLRTTIFYDTLMQMGRWFGYRPNYEDLCKVYMTEGMFDNFSVIIEATLDLMEELKRMSSMNLTPRDFGLAVQQHPDSGLQVTARNKLKQSKDIYFDMKLDGHLKETSWISSTPEDIQNNINLLKNTIRILHSFPMDSTSKNLWKNIDQKVVIEFLDNYKYYMEQDEFGLQSRMPVNFVKRYAQDIVTNWDIALATGKSDKVIEVDGIVHGYLAQRKLDVRDKHYEFRNRQVSSGNAEEVSLSQEIKDAITKELAEIKNNKKNQTGKDSSDDKVKELSRKRMVRQKLQRPLLILHLVEGTLVNSNGNTKNKIEVAAFSISFPGGIQSGNRNVKLKVNQVYVDNLEILIREEEDADDEY